MIPRLESNILSQGTHATPEIAMKVSFQIRQHFAETAKISAWRPLFMQPWEKKENFSCGSRQENFRDTQYQLLVLFLVERPFISEFKS